MLIPRPKNRPVKMTVDLDRLARTLETELGVAAVQTEAELLARRAIDEVRSKLVCLPEDADQVVAALRLCMNAGAAVTAWGGGTAMRIGNLPRRVDVVFDLSKLNRLIEHDHANLTATVEGGMALAALQKAVANQGQFAALDSPYPERSTVGGTVAANLNGPRRSCYGSVRDLVIGIKAALATGERIKAGGKVVKNVAGYDMCKLFVGSLGTLGIITEATLRMTPIAETGATITAGGNLTKLMELAAELARSTLLPAAVAILNSQATGGAEILHGDWQLAVRAEGFAENVARHVKDIRSMAERIGIDSETSQTPVDAKFWDRIRDFPLQSERLVYRITMPRASAGEVLQAVQTWQPADPAIVCDPAAGTLWVALTANEVALSRFAELTSLAAQHKGHAIIFSAPGHLKREIDVWGIPPPAMHLMRELKLKFDPKGLLNAGRFVGGL